MNSDWDGRSVDETKLELTVVDRLQILDLYARQSHAVDGGHASVWAQTFTANGTFHSPTYRLTATGHQALEDFAQNSHASARGRGEQLRHHVSAVVLDMDAPDHVSASAYLMILATSATGTRVDRSLTLIDTLARVDGVWRFASRTVVRDDAALATQPVNPAVQDTTEAPKAG